MSRVIFVGNVPYDMEEDQLIPIFTTVGPVAGFRLMIEKETRKSKGYAFCEYFDHETAASAVRNLNGTEVAGRPLRIDLADSDPFLEGKTTSRGEIIRDKDHDRDHGPRDPLANLPTGVTVPPGSTSLDVISKSLANIRPVQMMDILGQMKAYIASSPEQARLLLTAHPQLAYAFFQAMLMNNVVDPSILQRMLQSAASNVAPPVPPPAAAPIHHPPPSTYRPPPPPMPNYGAPPPSTYQPPAPVHHPPPAAYPPQPPAPQHHMPAPPTDLPEDQKAMLMSILSLSQEQVNALPPAEKSTVLALRAQFMRS
ncbi:hypothetical protein FRC03_008539 [Tulasnella sp. 419]|nr:hypothetical protein FRC03_008539 [Tulasnella sp. 419]